jgi:hypothetical protein
MFESFWIIFRKKGDIMIKYSVLQKAKTLIPIGITIKEFNKFDFSCDHMVCLLCGHSFRKDDWKCVMESPPHFLALVNKAMQNYPPAPFPWALSGACFFFFFLGLSAHVFGPEWFCIKPLEHVFWPCMVLHKTMMHGSTCSFYSAKELKQMFFAIYCFRSNYFYFEFWTSQA